MKKIISLALIFTFALVCLVSCTEGEVTYKNDVKTLTIYQTVSALLENNVETYIYAPENAGFESLGDKYQGTTHAAYVVVINKDWAADYFIETTGGNSCFEYGVFKAVSEEAKTSLKTALEAYIEKLKNDELGLSYSPDDKKILEKASVTVYGDYVVYVIIPEKDASTVLTRTENLLVKG